jgi:adenylate cyclase
VLDESASFNSEYRERQKSRLTRNLRVSLPVSALVALFFIPWHRLRDPSGDVPTTEILVVLSTGLMVFFGLTWLPRAKQYLDAITLAAFLWALIVVLVLFAMVPDGFLHGVGSLLGVIIVMTILAVDLNRLVALICAGSMLVIPNLALLLSNAPALEIMNTNWMLIPGVALAVTLAFIMDRGYRQTFSLEQQLAEEKNRSETLLSALLPAGIVKRLHETEDVIAEVRPQATVLFTDLVGFTQLSISLAPEELIELLTNIFTVLDELARKHGLEKIKTVGDSYMVAAGVAGAEERGCDNLAVFGLDSIDAVRQFRRPDGTQLDLRVGMAAGTVISGVIGRRKPYFDLWGPTVNLASRLQDTAPPGTVHTDAATARMLADKYHLTAQGLVTLRGIGDIETFLITGPRKPSPVEKSRQFAPAVGNSSGER